jgi:hypothetical protein
MAYADIIDSASYRTITVEDGIVTALCEKGDGKANTHQAYIGLAGIHDYQSFWTSMLQGEEAAIDAGEAFGLRTLVENNRVLAYKRTWHDTGNLEALAGTRQIYQEPDSPTILEKTNEAIWFVDGQVIKFSDDIKFIANRVQRARLMHGFVPQITGSQPHMYRYAKVEGEVISRTVTLPLFDRLLDFSECFWVPASLD